jgi:hypothetical protein
MHTRSLLGYKSSKIILLVARAHRTSRYKIRLIKYHSGHGLRRSIEKCTEWGKGLVPKNPDSFCSIAGLLRLRINFNWSAPFPQCFVYRENYTTETISKAGDITPKLPCIVWFVSNISHVDSTINHKIHMSQIHVHAGIHPNPPA